MPCIRRIRGYWVTGRCYMGGATERGMHVGHTSLINSRSLLPDCGKTFTCKPAQSTHPLAAQPHLNLTCPSRPRCRRETRTCCLQIPPTFSALSLDFHHNHKHLLPHHHTLTQILTTEITPPTAIHHARRMAPRERGQGALRSTHSYPTIP